MTWNFRVMRTIKGEFTIIELYYEDGKPVSYCNLRDFSFETLEDLSGELDLMKTALDKPIIEEETFVRADLIRKFPNYYDLGKEYRKVIKNDFTEKNPNDYDLGLLLSKI